jgi:hypothetical protein
MFAYETNLVARHGPGHVSKGLNQVVAEGWSPVVVLPGDAIECKPMITAGIGPHMG